MKRKQKEEMRAKNPEELAEELKKRQEEIAKLRIEIKMARVKDTSLWRRKMDELAVIKTILREQEFMKETLPSVRKGDKTK